MKIEKIVHGKTINMDIFKALMGCKQGNYRTEQLMQCKINEILKNEHKNRHLQLSYI